MRSPLISIVTATFNRSNVLRYTIAAVRASTLTDWEHLIVGDACTDDTAELVAGVADDRIRFVNLPRNVGEQSGPNNAGLRLATGRYIALLNHDDLWMPWHLDETTKALERTGADLVFTLSISIEPGGRPRLFGIAPGDRYERGVFAPCSSWVFRRELVEDIGPWRAARTLHLSPSTDWIERAHGAGKALLALPVVTMVVIPSGSRRASYAERQIEEHARMARALATDPRALANLVTGAALDLAREQRRVRPLIRRAIKNAAMRVVSSAGVHPIGLFNAVRYRRRGGFLDELRRRRGLTPLPRGGRHG